MGDGSRHSARTGPGDRRSAALSLTAEAREAVARLAKWHPAHRVRVGDQRKGSPRACRRAARRTWQDGPLCQHAGPRFRADDRPLATRGARAGQAARGSATAREAGGDVHVRHPHGGHDDADGGHRGIAGALACKRPRGLRPRGGGDRGTARPPSRMDSAGEEGSEALTCGRGSRGARAQRLRGDDIHRQQPAPPCDGCRCAMARTHAP